MPAIYERGLWSLNSYGGQPVQNGGLYIGFFSISENLKFGKSSCKCLQSATA